MSEDVARQEVAEDEKMHKASSWAVSKAWFNDVFKIPEDDPDRDERRAAKILANWSALRSAGKPLVDFEKVLAGAAGLGVDTDEEITAADDVATEEEGRRKVTGLPACRHRWRTPPRWLQLRRLRRPWQLLPRSRSLRRKTPASDFGQIQSGMGCGPALATERTASSGRGQVTSDRLMAAPGWCVVA